MFKHGFVINILMFVAIMFGLYYFRPDDTTFTIEQIATIFIGATVWGGLIAINKPTAQEALLTPVASESIKLPQTLLTLFDAIKSDLDSQITTVEAELKQVKSLMDNAIDDLVDCFIGLEASSRTGQNLAMTLVSNQAENNHDELNPFRDRHLKSKQLLSETSEKLKKLVTDSKLHENACNNLSKLQKSAKTTTENLSATLEKIAQTAPDELVNKVRDDAIKLNVYIADVNKISLDLRANNTTHAAESVYISDKIHEIINEISEITAAVGEELAKINTKIEQDVQIAVKSLQFQDMTTQLIVQCCARQKIIHSVLNSVYSVGHNGTNLVSIKDWQAKLGASYEQSKQSRNVRMKEFNVDTGSVEMF